MPAFSPVSSVPFMSELDTALTRLRGHDGVDCLILLERDGLVVKQIGANGTDESIAARIPGLVAACTSLGDAAGHGDFATAVLEFESGVAIVTALAGDLLLAVTVRPGVGFAPLLHELRRQRAHLIEFL